MKQLCLNREVLYNHLDKHISKQYDIKIDKKSKLIKIDLIKTGEDPGQILIYENIDGTTTMVPGKNIHIATSVAKDLIQASRTSTLKDRSFYLKAIRQEDFDIIIEFLVESGNCIESDIVDSTGRRTVKIIGKQNDTITLFHHRNKSFQARGKHIVVFSQLIDILTELLAFGDIIEAQLKFYETGLTEADIKGELETRLPTTYKYLEDKIKIIIAPSIALNKINLEIEDYSLFAFPILRGLEGILKSILLKNGIRIDNNGFNIFIIEAGKYHLNAESKETITDIRTRTIIEMLYNIFHELRNNIFHVDTTIVTTRILTKFEAEKVIDKVFDTIEKAEYCLRK